MPRTYVDNASNRSIGRVGMSVGSMVVSRGSSGGGGGSGYIGGGDGGGYSGGGGGAGYTSGKSYRSGRGNDGSNGYECGGGSSYGSGYSSETSSYECGGESSYGSGYTSSKTYVDNSHNRSLGRVGMPHGSMVASKSDSSRSSTPKTYACSSYESTPKTYFDNSQNRKLGRVGMSRGYMVVSEGATSRDYSRDSGIGASPMPHVDPILKAKVYMDNKLNRSLGRVGLPLGSAVFSKGSNSSTFSKAGHRGTYVNNTLNRSLGRVGKPLGSMPVSQISRRSQGARDILKDIQKDRSDRNNENYEQESLDLALSIVNRQLEEMNWGHETRERKAPKTSRTVLRDYSGQKIDFDEIELRRKIGQGGFGDVYFAKWKGSVVAVKKLRVERVSKRRLQEFTDEVLTFCKLDHPNIVMFIGACVFTPKLAIVMEYMQTSLFDALHMNEDVDFSEFERLEILQQTCAGLEYLHRKYMAHCDLKSQNILLDYAAGETCVAKITDFGLSMIKSNTESSTSGAGELVRNIGTPRYSAPEILRGEYLSIRDMLKSDVYSLSLIMFEVIYQVEPFYNLGYAQLRTQIGERGELPEIPHGVEVQVDYRVDDMMKKCWSFYPATRPSVRSVHHMFKEQQCLYVK